MKTKKKNKFRIIRTGEHEYEVWQLTVMLYIFHRWERIGTANGYEHAQGIVLAEVDRLGVLCFIDYIDNLK